MIEHLEDQYAAFIDELPSLVHRFFSKISAKYVSLNYTSQLGNHTGQAIHHSFGQIDQAQMIDLPLDTGFDRPIGMLRYSAPENSANQLEAKQFRDYICLKSYVLRNEICGAKIGSTVRMELNADAISRTGYNELAHSFAQILNTSGFVLWHICNTKKLSDGFELTYIDEEERRDRSDTFLHVLGAFPVASVDMPLSDGVASFVLRSGHALRIDNLLDPTEIRVKAAGAVIRHPEIVRKHGWRSGVFLPLSSQRRLVGVIGAYSSRIGGFNNLDEMLVGRCAEQIAAYFVVHRSRQRNEHLLSKVEQLGREVAAAQYSVFGSVHDAINAASGVRNNIDFVNSTRETEVYFRTLKDHVRQLTEVLGKLRSDIRNPKSIPLQRSKIPLREFLEERLGALRVDAKSNGIDLKIKVAKNYIVEGDRFRLSQVLFNVVSNAIRQFSNTTRHPKWITIDISKVTGEAICIQISDNGPGIEPVLLPDRLFEPFVTTTSGMGLGLTIVKSFVEEMGGSVSIASHWGEGATVSVTLPGRFVEV